VFVETKAKEAIVVDEANVAD
jgi:hypothetical protein